MPTEGLRSAGRRQAAKVGIQLAEVARRLRGGDSGLAFISLGGPQVHARTE